MWVGQQRKDGSVPAWVFYLVNEHDVKPMQGVITKCLFEMNHQKMFEEAADTSFSVKSQQADSNDAANDTWLEQQLVADRIDAIMENQSEVLSDFEYDRDGDNDGMADLEDIDEMYER